MYVDANSATQSNKYYNMFPQGDTFKVEYGRFGSTKTTKTYPISRWRSIYRQKTGKGYKDITDLKKTATVKTDSSGNKDFDEFYKVFSKYTRDLVSSTYVTDGASQAQIDEAQHILNEISDLSSLTRINEHLLELYKVIPRKMNNVRDHLLSHVSERDGKVSSEQLALDSMDSSNIIHIDNPLKTLNIDAFSIENPKEMEDFLYPTMGKQGRHYYGRNAKIHKVFKVEHAIRQKEFDDWVSDQKNKSTEMLIHGTRNANIFSILKSGLLVRPTNAASYAGSAYGNGIYHSAHSAKSLGYVGHDNDKLFLIQQVHMGKPYTYDGWYRPSKGLSRSDMTYTGLKKRGYDSLFVKPGDGLLNSEYVVYRQEQTTTSFLVWMK